MWDAFSHDIHVGVGIFLFFFIFVLLFGFQDHRIVGPNKRQFCISSVIVDGVLVGGVIEWIDDDFGKLALYSPIVLEDSLTNLFPFI